MSEHILEWTSIGSMLIVIFGLLARKAILSFFQDRSEIKVITAGDRLREGQVEEIERLQGVIRGLSSRVSELEALMREFMAMELSDASDIAELIRLVDSACPEACPNGNIRHIREALERMKARREAHQKRRNRE